MGERRSRYRGFIKNRIPTNVDSMFYIETTKCVLETDSLSVSLAENG